jgi:cytoskeleton protein RodZ
MKKTGEILRKSREEKGLSLHEVGIFLKINTRILQAIEDGDIEKLPAKTFLRGFVQSYAKYLKLDPHHVLKVFSDELRPPRTEAEVQLEERSLIEQKADEPEMADQEPTEEPKSSLYVGNSVSNDSIKQKMLVISVLGFLLVFVVYIGNNLIRRYQKEASLNVDVPVVDANIEPTTPEALSSTSEATNTIVSLPEMSAIPKIITPTATNSSEEIKKKEDVDVKPITPANNSTTTLPNANSVPANTTATLAPVEKKLPEGKPIEVIVEAKESVEIEYSSARTSPQKLLLKGEQIHTFKSRSGVRLKISNGGAVNVIVNGQDLGAPGAQGQPIQLNYE